MNNDKIKKNGRKLPIILTDDEVKRLLSVPNKRCFSGLRNYTIMKVILNCGLRSEDIVNLKVQDVNLKTGHTTIYNGKGAKDRCVYIKNDALPQLRKWVDYKNNYKVKEFEKSIYMFPTLQGVKLDTRCLRFSFKRYGDKVDIKKIVGIVNENGKVEKVRGVSPHILRATMASNYYRNTKDIRGLQLILGHSNLQVTERYMFVYNDEIASNLEHFQDKKKREEAVIEEIKELKLRLKELQNRVDNNNLFKY